MCDVKQEDIDALRSLYTTLPDLPVFFLLCSNNYAQLCRKHKTSSCCKASSDGNTALCTNALDDDQGMNEFYDTTFTNACLCLNERLRPHWSTSCQPTLLPESDSKNKQQAPFNGTCCCHLLCDIQQTADSHSPALFSENCQREVKPLSRCYCNEKKQDNYKTLVQSYRDCSHRARHRHGDGDHCGCLPVMGVCDKGLSSTNQDTLSSTNQNRCPTDSKCLDCAVELIKAVGIEFSDDNLASYSRSSLCLENMKSCIHSFSDSRRSISRTTMVFIECCSLQYIYSSAKVLNW